MSFFVAPTQPRNEETDAIIARNSPFTISLPAVSSNIICVHNQEVSANSVHQRFEVLSAPQLPNDNQDVSTSESYSNPSAIMPAEMIGEDIWSVILTHAPDGQLAFALTCRMIRDVVRWHGQRIRSSIAHAITSKARLKWALNLGCPPDSVCLEAAAAGELDVLTYARSLQLPWGHACETAAANGHLYCLKYAHQNGCAWNETTSTAAAANGHLLCLKYVHMNGCAWDRSPEVSACAAAAGNGQLDCLIYAHVMGCLWDDMTCRTAAANGHLACLKYAHEHGCQWDGDTREGAAENGHGTSRHARLPLTKATSQASNMPTNTAVHGTKILVKPPPKMAISTACNTQTKKRAPGERWHVSFTPFGGRPGCSPLYLALQMKLTRC